MKLKDWPAIIQGTAAFPQLMDFAALGEEDRNRFADKLAARSVAALKGRKSGKLDPDILAYEEGHRAFAGWKKQIGDALGMRSAYRRYSSKQYVEKLRDWTCELLRLGVNPGPWLKQATDHLKLSPQNPSVKFSPNYLFSDGVFESINESLHERGRNFNNKQSGRSKNNAYAGENDSRVVDFLRTVEGFDPAAWDETAINTLTNLARSVAKGEAIFIPKRLRAFAKALASQPWIGDS